MSHTTKYSHYIKLAELFDFPGQDYQERNLEIQGFVNKKYPQAAQELNIFFEGVPKDMLTHQELFTRTFDVQAITTLDIGYVLFGDDYKRAELLSNLTREHLAAGTDRKGELGDHLPNILRLMPHLQDENIIKELVSEILVPALMIMIREFDTERIVKRNTSYKTHYKTLIDTPQGDATIYRRLLLSLLEVLKQDFDVAMIIEQLENWSNRRQTADFLRSVEKEMEIEKVANPVNSGCDS